MFVNDFRSRVSLQPVAWQRLGVAWNGVGIGVKIRNKPLVPVLGGFTSGGFTSGGFTPRCFHLDT